MLHQMVRRLALLFLCLPIVTVGSEPRTDARLHGRTVRLWAGSRFPVATRWKDPFAVPRQQAECTQ